MKGCEFIETLYYYLTLSFVKIIDNIISTEKTLLTQKNKAFAASVLVAISQFIFFFLVSEIATDNNIVAFVIVSIASGIGSYIAFFINNKFSRDRTYVNVIMSDDFEEMKKLRGFLAANKITNVVNVSYTLDWEKTLAITAYAETKEQSRLIDEYLNSSDTKFKRVVQGERVKR